MTQRAPFIGGKGVEIAMTQPLFRAEGDVRAQFLLLGFLRAGRMRRGRRADCERVGETVVASGRRKAVAHLRQKQRTQLAFPIRITPEKLERGVEELALVRRGDERCG